MAADATQLFYYGVENNSQLMLQMNALGCTISTADFVANVDLNGRYGLVTHYLLRDFWLCSLHRLACVLKAEHSATFVAQPLLGMPQPIE